MTTTTKHIVSAEHAAQVWRWMQERGGIQVWQSVDLSDPGKTWTTPVNDGDGKPVMMKPSWQAASTPAQTITDANDVLVSVDREVKRFHVGIRVGAQGLKMKVTDGGSRRIRAAVAKAGEGAYHVFDYSTQEAVIMAPVETLPLSEYIARHPIT